MDDKTHVLLVEDNATDAYMLEDLLTNIPGNNFDITHVSALSEAQSACESRLPDVILLDLSLPDAHGLDTIKELKTVAADSPIVVMTGNQDADTIDLAVQAGAQDLLQKGEYSGKFLDKTIRYAIERKQSELELKHLAHFDPLTGIANRVLFIDNMNRALSHAKRHDERLSLMFIDLDDFKNINDTLGHEAGDTLLVQVADRLNRVLRECDTIARLGGDEFAIILEDISTVYNVDVVAKKILQTLTKPFHLQGQEMYVGASIGVAIFPEAGNDTNTLLKHADIAMYRAKKEGKNNHQIFTESLDSEGLNKVQMESDLQNALVKNQFELHYQPLYDIESGEIHSAEALLRWRHPDRKELIQPIEFISILEETGLIESVGEWVMRTACEQCNQWHKEGMTNFSVMVNVSPRQLQQKEPVEWIARVLQEAELDGKYLNIELTEGILFDDTDVAKVNISRIREMGVSISIDDFGIGHSYLSCLMNYELDVLKIDRGFLNTLKTNKATPVILKAIIDMAHGLNLQVVAEGIERDEQFTLIEKQGCDTLQSYLFSPPVEANTLSELINKHYPRKTMKVG